MHGNGRQCPLLVHPISYLFNQSVTQSKFPKRLKSAYVVPIFKKGSKASTNNYRPISLLHIFSKIFEKIMKKHIVKFIDDNNIISKNQFGFQQGKGTLEALTKFSTLLHQNLDKSKFVLSIFIDFSKAFDVVPHNLLLAKLKHYGIRDAVHDWFKDYLSDRSHQTIIEGKVSKSINLTLGVPQGSVLGPILFNLFINDLPNFSDILETILFADDANLSLAGYNPQELIITANIELFNFYYWCLCNRLNINTVKTYFILFSNVQYNLPLPPLMIKSSLNYDVIQRVRFIKFLGVFFDENVTFKKHVNYVTQRLTRTSSLIYQLRELMPSFVLLNMYHAHVNSVLSYCNMIWSCAHQTTLKSLVTIQKRIIRNVTHSAFNAHTEPLFRETNILNINQIKKFNLGIYFFKNNLNNLGQSQGNHNYLTRNRDYLRPIIHRTSAFHRSFLYQSVLLWNDLNAINNDLAHLNINRFKKLLKNYLMTGMLT